LDVEDVANGALARVARRLRRASPAREPACSRRCCRSRSSAPWTPAMKGSLLVDTPAARAAHNVDDVIVAQNAYPLGLVAGERVLGVAGGHRQPEPARDGRCGVREARDEQPAAQRRRELRVTELQRGVSRQRLQPR
jgi:hypothetical protein